jgi:hypothetical protein
MTMVFNYTISEDVIVGKVNSDRLIQEIRLSAIEVALDGVSVKGDELVVFFKADLSAADKTVLDGNTTGPCGGIIGNHSGEPLPDPKTEDGVPLVAIDGPRKDIDKKAVLVISPATDGFLSYITSRGDSESGRGEGPQLLITTSESDDPEVTHVIEVGFLEPIELHDGQVSWKPIDAFDAEDAFSLCARIPATPVTPGGAQNCTLYDVGGFNMIIPAVPGQGTHEVALETVCPVPDNNRAGYWEVEYNTGAVSVGPKPGKAHWNLFDTEIRVYFLKKVSMASPIGVFDIDVYETEYMHQSWKLRFEVFKKNAANGKVSGWVFMFRRNVT